MMMSGNLTSVCFCSQPDVQDVPLLALMMCPRSSWQQHPHDLEWSVVGPKKSVGLRGSQGPNTWQQHPTAKDWVRVPRRHQRVKEVNRVPPGMDPVYPCWTARLTRTKDHMVQSMLQNVRSLHACSPGGPVSRHVRMHVKLQADFVLVPRAVSSQNQSSSTIQKIHTTYHPREEKRQHGSALLVCKMLL